MPETANTTRNIINDRNSQYNQENNRINNDRTNQQNQDHNMRHRQQKQTAYPLT